MTKHKDTIENCQWERDLYLTALLEIADPFSHPLAKPESTLVALREIARKALIQASGV